MELDEIFTENIETCFNANYLFTLGAAGYSEGILAVNADVNHGLTTGTNAEELHGALEEALAETVPEEFGRVAFDMQTRDILGDDLRVSCVQFELNNCEGAANLLALAIQDGGVTVGLTPDQRDQLVQAANNPEMLAGPLFPNWYTGLKNWRCMPSPEQPNAGPFCQYVLRAINAEVHPDEIELVWFDGAEYDNPAYALAVAAYATDDPGSILGQLCNYDPNADTVPFARRFARHNLGFTLVDID